MITYINKALSNYNRLFNNCVIQLIEPHKAGDIINGRIILTDFLFYHDDISTDKEVDDIIYPAGHFVRAIQISEIDDIITPTDMRPYGFTQVDDNRYCKTNEAIRWALMEVNCDKALKHKMTKEELDFWSA